MSSKSTWCVLTQRTACGDLRARPRPHVTNPPCSCTHQRLVNKDPPPLPPPVRRLDHHRRLQRLLPMPALAARASHDIAHHSVWDGGRTGFKCRAAARWAVGKGDGEGRGGEGGRLISSGLWWPPTQHTQQPFAKVDTSVPSSILGMQCCDGRSAGVKEWPAGGGRGREANEGAGGGGGG